MSETEWDCEGCGVHVVAFGINQQPIHGFCATCAWLSQFVEPHEIMDVLRRCEGMGHPRRQEFDPTLLSRGGPAQRK